MKKRLLLLLLIFTGSNFITSAQEVKREQPAKKGCSCSLSSINQAGVLNGSKGAFFSIQSINGIKYKTWFAGVGVGYDTYFRSGIPVFIDVRKNLLNKSQTPFLYADIGYHFLADKKDQVGQWYQNTYSNGAYTDVGIGYKFGFYGKDRWVISAGYSYKYVKYVNEYTWPCPTERCYENYLTYKNYLHRYVMRLGFQL